MVRALLDANVLVSAAIRSAGPPGRILAALLERQPFESVLSPAVIAEAERVLQSSKVRRYLREPREVLLFLADVVALSDLVPDTGGVTGVCRDPGDDVVLAAAMEGRADCLVTGDADLLTLREYEGIAIVTPRAFLDLLAG